MGRRKREPMGEGKKKIIAGLIGEYDIRTAKDIEDALKDLMGGTIHSNTPPCTVSQPNSGQNPPSTAAPTCSEPP